MHSRLPWPKADLNSPFHVGIVVCLVTALSYLAAMLGGAMSLPGTLSPLWPGCALLVAVLLLTRRKIWPALIAVALAGFFLYDMRVGLTVRAMVLLFAADIVEVLVAALGVSYTLGGTLRLNSIKRMATYLLLAGILAPVSGALIGAVAMGVNFWTMWRISFFSEALALLTLTPAILGWVNTALTRPPKSVAYYLEEAVLTAGVGAFGYFTFVASGGANRPVLLYSLVPFLLWSALRFGSTGTATSTLLVAFLSIWGATRGRGPFTGSVPLTNVLSLQLFLVFAAIPFMFLAALVEEREEAAQALGESEARERTKATELETILEAVPVAVLIANDPKCKRITANRAGCKLLHLAPGANASKSALADEQPKFRIMVDGVEVSAEQLPIQRAAATGKQTFELPEMAIFEDGTERNLIANAAPLLGEDGKPYGAVAALLDVTERERAQKALRESEERFRLAAQAGKMFAYEWDVATDLIERSPEAAQILGIDEAAQTTGQRILAKVQPEDRERVTAAIAALSPEKPDLRISFRMVRSDGTMIWVERSSRAQFDGQGRLLRLVGMVADVTERKRAEEERQESESRFWLMADTAPVLIWMSGPDKLCTYFNKQWLDFTGRSIDSELGNGWAEGVHREDLQRCLEVYTQAFDRREEFRMEYRLRRHDGEYRWVFDTGVPRFNPEGSFAGYIGSCIDITERKQAEVSLKESEEKFATAFRESPMSLTLTSAKDHRYLDVNETFERITGWGREEVIGRTPSDIQLWKDPAQRVAALTKLLATGSIRNFEFQVRCRDGSEKVGLGSAELIEIQSELCVLSVTADVTDLKKAEEALTSLPGRLIEAHEEERRRIAREIHDDYQQRVAMLAIHLEALADNIGNTSTDASQRLRDLRDLARELGADLHDLSHSLHSSTLESLGLVAGMRAFCKEFAAQQSIQIDFAHENVPRAIPGDAALCLFRIAQEGLRNVKRHSGADRAEVRLEASGEKLHLSISDRGRGFDLKGSRSGGIGIRSMEERLRLLGGNLEIHSRPTEGTRIDAWVSFNVSHQRAS